MREVARRRQRRDHVALLDGAAVDAADEGTYVGGSAASEYRNVDASRHGNVSAGPSAWAPEGDGVAGSDADRLPHRQWRVIEHRREIGPGDGDHSFGKHPKLQAGEKHLEPCTARSSAHKITLAGIVPDEQVADAQGEPICRTRWGHARSEISRAANILNRRLGTAVEHLEHYGPPSSFRGGWSRTGLTSTRALVGPGRACGRRVCPSSPGAGSCPLGSDIHKRPLRTAV